MSLARQRNKAEDASPCKALLLPLVLIRRGRSCAAYVRRRVALGRGPVLRVTQVAHTCAPGKKGRRSPRCGALGPSSDAEPQRGALAGAGPMRQAMHVGSHAGWWAGGDSPVSSRGRGPGGGHEQRRGWRACMAAAGAGTPAIKGGAGEPPVALAAEGGACVLAEGGQ